MADRMKWLIGTIAMFIVIVVFVRSIDLRPDDRNRLIDSSAHVATDIMIEERLLREAVWADSLLPRLPDAPGLVLEISARLQPAFDSLMRTSVAAEWQTIEQPRARIGVFVIPDTLGAYYKRIIANERPVYYAGSDSSGAYCMVVIPTTTLRDNPRPQIMPGREYVLGPCRWWALYGEPGARISNWLQAQGGYRFAVRPASTQQRDVPAPVRRQFAQRPAMGGLSPSAMACITGNTAHCARTMLEPRDTRSGRWSEPRNGVPVFRSYWGTEHYAWRDHFLLAELEHEFGQEQFASFWRSGEDVAAAFASAFGASLGEWVHQWALATFTNVAPTRDDSALTLSLSLLALVVLSTVGIREAQRRQIR